MKQEKIILRANSTNCLKIEIVFIYYLKYLYPALKLKKASHSDLGSINENKAFLPWGLQSKWHYIKTEQKDGKGIKEKEGKTRVKVTH